MWDKGIKLHQEDLLNKKLFDAAKSGEHELLSRALGEGAEITYRGDDGDTGLHQGAMLGRDSVVRTFLEAGIDVSTHCPGSPKVKIFVSIDMLYTNRTVSSARFQGCVTSNPFMEGKKSYSIFL